MLCPLLYSHYCVAKHDSNTIIKFADNTMVVGLIPNNDETAYREEVRDLAVGCQDNALSLKKEMIMEYRKRRAEHTPNHIDGAVGEQVASFKFLVVHITNKLSWSKDIKKVVKSPQETASGTRAVSQMIASPDSPTISLIEFSV